MQKTKIVRGIRKIAKTGLLSALLLGILMPLAMAADPGAAKKAANEATKVEISKDMCELIKSLQGVFKTLRILAFIGAAFLLARAGWDAILTGKLGGKDKVTEGAIAVGMPMIIGFAILFMIGILLGALANGRITGCNGVLFSGWN